MSVTVTETSSPSVTPSVTSTPIAVCSAGWMYYADDGSEGHDSCLGVFTSTSITTFSALNDACIARGGHLLTAQGLPDDLSGILPTAASLLLSSSAVIGCLQSASAVQRGASWLWVDGTDAGNLSPLNCSSVIGAAALDGGLGCLPWARGEPKYVLLLTVEFE